MAYQWEKIAFQNLEKYQSGQTVILIRLDQQKLYLFDSQSLVCSYPISSSRYGIGCDQDSRCTPTGIHRIAEKIGQQCQHGEILRARIAIGEIAEINKDATAGGDDVITSRIMWLQGLESGLNLGAGVDSYQRYIYIHGTNEEGLIGQPASQGCIRMKNDDVMDLFDKVEEGALVLILPE
ncbi:MAG: L,D-transpeptidase [Gammaproteobacteria bacterium]|nr:L,D-transpeptidase [Gammaproteobacteria bacterium]